MSRDKSKPNDNKAIEAIMNNPSIKQIQEQIENLSSIPSIRKLEEQVAQLQPSENILPESLRTALEVANGLNSHTFKILPSSTLEAIESATSIAHQRAHLESASLQSMQVIENARALSSIKFMPDSVRAIAEAFAEQQQKFAEVTSQLSPIKAVAASIAEMSLAMSSSPTLREFVELNRASAASIDATMKAFEKSSVELGSDAYSNHKESFEYIAQELTRTGQQFDALTMESTSLEQSDDLSLEKVNVIATLVTHYQKLPRWAQLILTIFLNTIAIPILISISANLLTSHVEKVIQDSDKSERQKLKEIRQLPLKVENIETSGLRFITAEHVRLREGPSTKSQILDDLKQGQIVTVLSKKRNWIEIKYEYGEGDIVTGWVFTRYTARFSNSGK